MVICIVAANGPKLAAHTTQQSLFVLLMLRVGMTY